MASTTGAAADARRQQQQQLFREKYGELLEEARGVARDFGVNVRAVAFLPGGGGAVQHEFLGATRDARMVGCIRRAVARDVSAMGVEEAAEHERQLGNMRAVVERALQAKAAAAAAAVAAAAGGVKRAPPEQQQQQQEAAATGAGGSKMCRILIE